MATIFEKIIAGELPCDKVYEDERCIVFHDINPVAPFHVLVVPKKLIDRLSNARSVDSELLGHLMLVAAKVSKESGYEDFRVINNNGAGAGQTVFHFHLHVIAGRKVGFP